MTLQELKEYRAALMGALMALAANPAASATVSSGGGSKSYTNRDIAELRAEIDRVDERIAALSGRGGVSVNYARWC